MSGTGTHRTALYSRHVQLGAKLVDFHGWQMPIYYTSIIDEHKAVRHALGIFDVSHMGQVLVTGAGAQATLDRLMTNNIQALEEGRACYTLMLDEAGGILDDLIIYRIGPEDYLIIVNCGNRASDVAWMQAHRQEQTSITDISEGRSILAVQGPQAARVLERLLDAQIMGLARFRIAPMRTMSPEACIARTGYTGSDGFELFLPNAHALRVWDGVLADSKAVGGMAVGLGARDTLRVEAGLRLYGTDIDTTTNPYEAELRWTVAMDKGGFIGRDALVKLQAQGLTRRFVGLEMAAGGPVPRTGCELLVQEGAGWRKVGAITSGTFSPVLAKPLGMGYVEPAFGAPGTVLTVTVRSQRYAATVVKLPFWKGEPKLSVAPPRAAPTLGTL